MRDTPARLLPNLRPRGLVVHARIILVCKLVQHAALALVLHLVGQVARIFHAAAFGRQNQLGSKRFHGLRPLNRQVLGHDQHHAVAFDGGGHGQCNARVARGRFNQRVARLDLAALLRPRNHGHGRAVFYAARRVVALQLAQNHIVPLRTNVCPNPLQARQRCFANGVFNRGVGKSGRVF